MAAADPKPDPLRRLGGGRWETRDGRFQIEPQSGTWVIVDTSQTNEFGLPLVRGPYGSLGAAREAIETARSEGPLTSPLAERIEKAGSAPAPSKRRPAASRPTAQSSRATAATDDAPPAEAPTGSHDPPEAPEPPEPPEPRWFRGLKPASRTRAIELIARLRALGVETAEEVARAEVVEGRPALARLALERKLRQAAASATTPRDAVIAAIDVFLAGDDPELETAWRLVDDRERPIRALDIEAE